MLSLRKNYTTNSIAWTIGPTSLLRLLLSELSKSTFNKSPLPNLNSPNPNGQLLSIPPSKASDPSSLLLFSEILHLTTKPTKPSSLHNKSSMQLSADKENTLQSELMILIRLKDLSNMSQRIQVHLNSFHWIKKRKWMVWAWWNHFKTTNLKNTFIWSGTVQFIHLFWTIKIEFCQFPQSSTLTIQRSQSTPKTYSFKLQHWADPKPWLA